MTRSLPEPFRLVALDRVDSTNDEAKRAALEGAGHGTVVWAAEQTAGRGRRGREWLSPAGNLHCSLLLDPGLMPSRVPQLAFVAALAVRAALAELVPAVPFQVKWPNDILCRGRKIAGMLLEQAPPFVVVGIGVDVAHAPEPGLYPTTCLRLIGSGAEPFDVLAGLCAHLGTWYARWRQDGFAPIRQAWLAEAAGLSGPVTVRLANESTLEGHFAGLDAEGALLLDRPDGEQRKILAGDVFFPR
jgi:BirA family biotin operon repressor/biotin-[acetyl-CoA-carboxylase] ligase